MNFNYLVFPRGNFPKAFNRIVSNSFFLWVTCLSHHDIMHFTSLTRLCNIYKVVQIWPGLISPDLHTNSPGHIWTTLYKSNFPLCSTLNTRSDQKIWHFYNSTSQDWYVENFNKTSLQHWWRHSYFSQCFLQFYQLFFPASEHQHAFRSPLSPACFQRTKHVITWWSRFRTVRLIGRHCSPKMCDGPRGARTWVWLGVVREEYFSCGTYLMKGRIQKFLPSWQIPHNTFLTPPKDCNHISPTWWHALQFLVLRVCHVTPHRYLHSR